MYHTGFSTRKLSDVGSYEFAPGTDMRPNVDDFFDIYGPSSFRSSNHPKEDYTYVHTFGKTQRKRLRHNLSKNGGAIVSGYSIQDPVVLAAENNVMYSAANDHNADYFDFTGGLASRFKNKDVYNNIHHDGIHNATNNIMNRNAEIPSRAGMVANESDCPPGSTYGEMLYKPHTNVPPRNSIASITYRTPPGLNAPFLPPPPVPEDNKKFSNHQLTAVDPRSHASQYVPVSQIQMVPLSVSGSRFGRTNLESYNKEKRALSSTNTLSSQQTEDYSSKFAQTSPSMGCGFPSAALSASEPQMIVQGEFSAFDTPPNVVQNIHSPFLRNTTIGHNKGSQAGVFIPYQKPLALPSRSGHFISLEDYMQESWTTGVEGLGV